MRAFHEDRGAKAVFRISPTPLTGGLKFLVDVAEDDARRAANDPRPVVFCPPIATFCNGRSAAAGDIVEGLALTVECDQHPQQARARLSRSLAPPRSWCAREDCGPTTDAGKTRQAAPALASRRARDQKNLSVLNRARKLATALVGGDPSNVPIVHPIRWPGSWHRKAEPRLCKIESANPDREIMLELALDALEHAAVTTEQAKGKGATSDRSRIEWEEAFRLILSGESYHPTLVPLAASFASWGAPAPVTDNVLHSLLTNSRPKIRSAHAGAIRARQAAADGRFRLREIRQGEKSSSKPRHRRSMPRS